MEQSQMSKFCIDLEDVMLPDAIAAVVEAWYDYQSDSIANEKVLPSILTLEQVQKVMKKSRATIYRYINTSKETLNPPYDPQKLNHEYRCDKQDPIIFTLEEVNRFQSSMYCKR
jgi:hypothetical protein